MEVVVESVKAEGKPWEGGGWQEILPGGGAILDVRTFFY